MGYPLKMSIAKVACYLETPNVRVCAHSPIESLIGKERNATTSHFVSDYGAARILECERPRNRIRSTFTMFATRNEVYSEFVSEVLDNFSERY